MSSNKLRAHLDFLWSHDREFVERWTQLSPLMRIEYRRIFLRLEQWSLINCDCHPTWQEFFGSADVGAGCSCQASDINFVRRPEPNRLITVATDSERVNHVLGLWRGRLQRFLDAHRQLRARMYGGIKKPSAVRDKIRHYCMGLGDLDLWDLVRFRIVVHDLNELQRIAASFQSAFGSEIIRCRDYYHRPRNDNCPYRAVHFELENAPFEYAEVQLLTLTRDALGLLDHALVHKRSLRFLDAAHERWWSTYSHLANLVEKRHVLKCRERSRSQHCRRRLWCFCHLDRGDLHRDRTNQSGNCPQHAGNETRRRCPSRT